MRLSLPVFWLGLIVLSGCSLDLEAPGFKKSADVGSGSSASYTYDYTENGCATGKKSFNDKGQYCTSLHDEAANNGCAKDLRDREFNANCQ